MENRLYENEFEDEMMQQEEIEKEQMIAYCNDMIREQAGLTSLSAFENMFLDGFRESKFVKKLLEKFERINLCYSNLEEVCIFYDELKEYINGLQVGLCIEMIEKWNKIMKDWDETCVSNELSGIQEIIEWINDKEELNDYSEIGADLPDYVEYGDKFIFYNMHKEKIELEMDDLELCCEELMSDLLEINVSCENKVCAKGKIEICYGYAEETYDGSIGDNDCDESITYEMEEILQYIESVIEEFENYVGEEMGIVEALKDELEI